MEGTGAAGFGTVELTVDFVAGFFLFDRATESGLNMSGLPVSFTSCAGFWPSGIVGSASLFGAGRLRPPAPSSLLYISSTLLLLNAAALLVFSPIPGGFDCFVDGLDAADAPVFLGAGRNELKPEKRPLPAVLVRLAGGPSTAPLSEALPADGGGRLIISFPLFEASTSFWNGFLPLGSVVVVDWGGFCVCCSVSDPESSDSE